MFTHGRRHARNDRYTISSPCEPLAQVSLKAAGSGEDFLRVFTIYGRGGHLGHVSSIMSSDFHFLVPESLNTK